MIKSGRLLALLVGAATAASSFAISIRFDGTDLGQNIGIVYQGSAETVFAGQLRFTDLTNNQGLSLYCADVDHSIHTGDTYNVDVAHTQGDAAFGSAGSIVTSNAGAVTTNDEATALQIAAWASVYNLNLSTNTGSSLVLDGNWYASHLGIVGLAINMTSVGIAANLDGLHYVPNPPASGQGQLGPVPEPASLLALGAGLLAFRVGADGRRACQTRL